MSDAAHEYDALAEGYHWIYSDRMLTGGPFVETHRERLDALRPGAPVLDCACGIGIHAVALSRMGFKVSGSDASSGMLGQARERVRKEGLSIPLQESRWQDLPEKWDERFDLVFCTGNAIGHSIDEEDMVRSLRGMRGVLADNGCLVIETRNWEKLMANPPDVTPLGPRAREGVRGIPVYFWTFPPDWTGSVHIDVVFLFQQGSRISFDNRRVTYYPFRSADLARRLEMAGFSRIVSTYSPEREVYVVQACPT